MDPRRLPLMSNDQITLKSILDHEEEQGYKEKVAERLVMVR
jgi:hypothetical protein